MEPKIITFSVPTDRTGKCMQANFAETEGGFEVDMMLFSTAFNRNKYFFQVAYLLTYQDKLTRILFNFNHDLTLTGDKYLGNKTQFTKLWHSFSNGAFEVWGRLKTTDPLVVAQKDNITAPSVELTSTKYHKLEGGGYFIEEFDWGGCALLLGVQAGSGDARLGEIFEFDLNLKPLTKPDMTEQQVKALLEEQKNQLTADFASKTDELKATFSEELGKVLNGYKTASVGQYTWTGSDGKQYQKDWSSVYKSVTRMLESKSVEDSPLENQLAAEFSSILNKSAGTVPSQGQNTDPESTPPAASTAPSNDDLEAQYQATQQALTAKKLANFSGNMEPVDGKGENPDQSKVSVKKTSIFSNVAEKIKKLR